ncbi:phosphoserine aminotransferase [Alicycliphilus sp. B1]|nr:phosphoserine aminotransferase [Alicycliphilus sp. B1]
MVREDLLGHACPICPSAFDYKIVADNQIHVQHGPAHLGRLHGGPHVQWLKRQREGDATGVAAMERRNIAKAKLFYDYIDGSQST